MVTRSFEKQGDRDSALTNATDSVGPLRRDLPAFSGALLNTLKVFALASMVFDHLVWLSVLWHPMTSWTAFILWRTPGRFAMPLFAFLLGLSAVLLTSNLRNMLFRLVLFAVLSQPVYNLYFGPWDGLNALWSLALGVWMLSWGVPPDRSRLRPVDHLGVGLLLGGMLIFWWITAGSHVLTDWNVGALQSDLAYALAVPWVGFFAGRGVFTTTGQGGSRLIFSLGFLGISVFFNLMTAPFVVVMILVSGVLFFFPWLSRWPVWRLRFLRHRLAFYVFYPAHLLVLYVFYLLIRA